MENFYMAVKEVKRQIIEYSSNHQGFEKIVGKGEKSSCAKA